MNPPAPVSSSVVPAGGRSCRAGSAATSRASSRMMAVTADMGSVVATPYLPRGPPLLPQALEQAEVAQRVHALPEVVVPIRYQLPISGQPLERRVLPRGVIAVDVVEDARLEHEESAVDPAFADLRLLGEGAHQLSVEGEPAEARGRRTAVTVASFPWWRWNSTRRRMSTLETPSPYVMRKVPSRTQDARRLMRPPVWVAIPVSIRWTSQSSRLPSCASRPPARRSTLKLLLRYA